MRTLGVIAVALLLAACAMAPPAAPAAGGQTFTGEVWTWDEPNNVVTLYAGEKLSGFLHGLFDGRAGKGESPTRQGIKQKIDALSEP